MGRPASVINLSDVPGEKRPRFTNTRGVGAVVRTLGAATGLTAMGVHLRSVPSGLAGTNRHFHTVEEEWSYVLSGRGRLRIGPLEFEVGPGDFAGYPPGPRPHHFINDGDEELVFLEGGESRESEDGCWYPDARLMSQGRKAVEPYVEPPPEEGEASQVCSIEDLPIKSFQHDVDSGARRRMRVLHTGTGLERQAIYWAEVAAGDRSTAYHTHEKTDEWVFILDGTAVVDLGDEQFEVGANDFLGHPVGSAPHVMQASTNLTYLMGGQIDATDVVSYPRHRMQRVGGRLEPMSD